jgi:hypothetical protein
MKDSLIEQIDELLKSHGHLSEFRPFVQILIEVREKLAKKKEKFHA